MPSAPRSRSRRVCTTRDDHSSSSQGKVGPCTKKRGDASGLAPMRPRDGDPSKVIPGKYYVEENGTIALLEDPAITGRITERDDGTVVKMKFKAPKTEVIGIIIKGVLESKLNWPLVLIGR